MSFLPRPLLSEQWFEGACHQAVTAPAHSTADAALLTLQGPERHHVPQRQSPEATGHSGRSREKNLLLLCATVFTRPWKHRLPPGSKNSLERIEKALPTSVCSPSAPTKEVRHEKELFDLAWCVKMDTQSCSSKYVYNNENPKTIRMSTNGGMWYG